MDINPKKYTLEKWKEIMELSLNNYINMRKRLHNRKKFADFILMYYSFLLIFFSLINVIYIDFFNSKFFNLTTISLSIILLVFSSENKSSRYAERTSNLDESINLLKTLKRNENEKDLDELQKRYNEIVDNTEMREDIDFHHTLKSLCKKENIDFWNGKKLKGFESYNNDKEREMHSQIKRYISEHNSFYYSQVKCVINLLKVITIILPIIYLVVELWKFVKGS